MRSFTWKITHFPQETAQESEPPKIISQIGKIIRAFSGKVDRLFRFENAKNQRLIAIAVNRDYVKPL